MKIYDISQEVFSCVVYPGDPAPKKRVLCDMEHGALYNLTTFSMCSHNGTHVDAPAHFIRDGKTIDALPLEKTVGQVFVAEHEGTITADDAYAILQRANDGGRYAVKRILVKGKAVLSLEAAEVFAKEKLDLYGNESQTVGPADAPMATHLVLLGAETVLLEGVRLGEVSEGWYMLCAAPLALGGSEGAPCRAILMDMDGAGTR